MCWLFIQLACAAHRFHLWTISISWLVCLFLFHSSPEYLEYCSTHVTSLQATIRTIQIHRHHLHVHHCWGSYPSKSMTAEMIMMGSVWSYIIIVGLLIFALWARVFIRRYVLISTTQLDDGLYWSFPALICRSKMYKKRLNDIYV